MKKAKLPQFTGTVAWVALSLVPTSGGADVGASTRMMPAPSRATVQATATISPSLIARGKGRTMPIDGRSVPVDEYLAKTPSETPITLRSGYVTTLGALLGSYAKLDAALKQHGSSFDQLAHASKAPDPKWLPVRNVTTVESPGDPDRKQIIAREEHGTWKINPYSTFAAYGADPATADSSECTVSWNAGLNFYNKAIDIVKVTGSEQLTSAGALQASLTISVLGKSVFAGDVGTEGDGAPPFEQAISTSQLPGGEPSQDFSILGDLIKVHAVGGGSAYVKIVTRGQTGSVQLASGANNGFYCSTGITPMLRTEVHMRAEADIGNIDGHPALKISAHGTLVPIELDFPTKVTLAIQKAPLKIGFGFQSKLHVQLMTGKIHFNWELPDKCVGGFCLVGDGLQIPTKGEVPSPWSWDQTNPPFNTTIADQAPALAAGETLVPR